MFLYNLGIYFFQFGLKLASLFYPKAKLWVEGRKNWEEQLRTKVDNLKLENAVWFHCASLGEFEQGRPVIEKLKKEYPGQKIVLSFFSPSGYEIQKNYPFADLVTYLPADTPSNARIFLSILQPKLAIFVKYEFWLNYLFELERKQIPAFLISTVIKKHQPFFKWYGGIFRKALVSYKTIYTQDVYSIKLLRVLRISSGVLTGDTRFDRVLQVCSAPKKINEIEEFAKNAFVIIAGSSWQKDEEHLIESYIQLKEKHPQLKLIIAPHEIDRKNIDRLKNLLAKNGLPYHLFSDNATVYIHPILVINAIGFLSSVYQYGTIAMIGGGFNNGIHNILEPTVYGLPVLFGPNYKKFNEAFEIIDLNAGFVISDSSELTAKLSELIENKVMLAESSRLAKNYVRKNSGATNKIVDDLRDFLN
ncbi:MAG: 3-deoxy-D-manno-octulosonic acid transferase [Bacteroidetes bacterium]|jgi:3-deoxy-D-manno-octulosonic-acid transferase|nr:3-deoxy-D-manno-octulosonic acid transferase [Bacteroidota bacterium]MDF2450863.1 3-deoxy-D-manno-octulosonic acid transferase [Bacteroidota bacterium]